jgi:hypothetical protein
LGSADEEVAGAVDDWALPPAPRVLAADVRVGAVVDAETWTKGQASPSRQVPFRLKYLHSFAAPVGAEAAALLAVELVCWLRDPVGACVCCEARMAACRLCRKGQSSPDRHVPVRSKNLQIRLEAAGSSPLPLWLRPRARSLLDADADADTDSECL